jgi:mannose/fructose/N-acetylgalactosamine-specific phosphotransferase system component IIC
MSGFLYRLPTTITPLARSTFTRQAPRAFSVAITQRAAADTVKEPLKKVDRAVSDTIVKGIDAAGKILLALGSLIFLS